MTRHRTLVVGGLLSLVSSLMVLAPACTAQATPPSAPASTALRYRITWRSGIGTQREVGQLAYRDSAAIVLWASATRQYSVVTDSITRVQFGARRPHSARKGALTGALAGGIIGALIASATHQTCQADPNCITIVDDPGLNALFAGAVWGGLGGGIGALVGRARRDVWRDTVLMAGGRTVPTR